jgi:hypothetical protein
MYSRFKKEFQTRNERCLCRSQTTVELRTEELSNKCEAVYISLSSPGGAGVARTVALPNRVILPPRRGRFSHRGTDGSKIKLGPDSYTTQV